MPVKHLTPGISPNMAIARMDNGESQVIHRECYFRHNKCYMSCVAFNKGKPYSNCPYRNDPGLIGHGARNEQNKARLKERFKVKLGPVPWKQ